MKMLRSMLLVLAATMSAGTATTVRADHEREFSTISTHADAIVCATRELNDELRQSFHCSRLYGELRSTNSRIRSKANYLRAQARACRCSPTFRRFVCDLDELICRLDSLVNEARLRAARGIDPPIGCTRAAELKVARMRQALNCIKRELSSIGSYPVIGTHDEVAPGYPGEWEYEGASDYEHGIGTGMGYGGGYGRGSRPDYRKVPGGTWPNIPGHGSGRDIMGSAGYGRGINLDRTGLTLQTGAFSVHLNR